MVKKKVFEVAKQFSIPPGALLRQLKGMGSAATSPMSILEPAILEELEKGLQEERAARRKKTAVRKKSKTAQAEAEPKAKPKAKPKPKPKAKPKAAPEDQPVPVAAAEDVAAESPAAVAQAEPERVAVASEADTSQASAAVEATAEVAPDQAEPVPPTPEPAPAPEAESAPETTAEVETEIRVEEAEAAEAAASADAEVAEAVAEAEPEPQPAPEAEMEAPEPEPEQEQPEAEAEAEAEAGEAAEPKPAEPEEQKPARKPKLIPAPRQTATILFRPTTPVAPTLPSTGPPRKRRPAAYRMDAADPFAPAPPRDGGHRSASMAGAVSRRAEKKRKKRKAKGAKVDEKTVQDSVRKTMAQMSKGDRRKKRRRDRDADQTIESDQPRSVQMAEYATVSEFALALQVAENDVILKLLGLGIMATRNQRLEMDTITMIADEFDVTVQPLSEIGEDRLQQEEDLDEDLRPRHPIVTVMGHVDHGKTSLLDQIRQTNVVRGEKGGITQHIGAYEVETPRGRITFMDTPGHEAFTAMRLRGAQVTDMVILVVAADDGVMPQTAEAIDHARAAKVPIVVAINKCDLPGAQPLRVKQMLTEHNLVVEDFGGSVQAVEVSAKTAKGLDRLLETVLLEAEMLELKANPNRRADGVVVEAFLDRGKGPVATVLVQRGALEVGQAVIAGLHTGKIRALLDERDRPLQKVEPASPAKLLGLSGVPQAGDTFHVVRDEPEAREIASQRGAAKRTSELKRAKLSLDSFMSHTDGAEIRELPIIVKGDVDGSVEALSDSLERLSNDEVRVEVIRRGVGGIAESDVMLAATSSAVILGFHVRPSDRARELASQEQVDIRLYDVIYDAVADVRMALEGLLAPELKEQIDATVEVREVFKVPKIGAVAGCHVLSGKVRRNARLRVVRDDIEVFDSKVASLRRFKDDVKEVAEGFECGIGIERFNDIKVGDRLEIYSVAEIARKLEVADS